MEEAFPCNTQRNPQKLLAFNRKFTVALLKGHVGAAAWTDAGESDARLEAGRKFWNGLNAGLEFVDLVFSNLPPTQQLMLLISSVPQRRLLDEVPAAINLAVATWKSSLCPGR